MVLFGFASADERSLFDQLVTVSGVGPKLALAVLSVLSPEALRRAIATGDVGRADAGAGRREEGRGARDPRPEGPARRRRRAGR